MLHEKVNLKALYIYIYIILLFYFIFILFYSFSFFSLFDMKPHRTSVTKNIFPYQRYLGGGEGFYIRLWCGGRRMRSDHHSSPSDGCDALWRSGPGLYTWPMRKPWWSNPRHRLIDVSPVHIGSHWDLPKAAWFSCECFPSAKSQRLLLRFLGSPWISR